MWILFLLLTTARAMTCDEMSIVYQDSSCCTGGSETCLRAIPSCANVTNGLVCYDGSNVVVKGLLDAFAFQSDRIDLKKHLIPTQNAAFDLGNAEYKIRHLFLSDN